MDTTARNLLALSALILLPLLEAYCPRLAPDVISGKIIPCRYLCIRINFFEMPSIILSTERDGVLCSTLLLRRRGVCKNGGCYPFESEDQKRRGMFRRVITNIDKFASGSYKKPVDKPGAQSGPIVSIIPSLLGRLSKDTTNGTAPPAIGLPPSSPASPPISASTSNLVKSVSSTLTSIWAHAFPLHLKAGPPRRSTATSTAAPNTPEPASGGMTAASSDRTSTAGIGGGPPIVPPQPAEGSPTTGQSRGPKLLEQIPRLSSALAFRNTLMKLRRKSSASSASIGSPISRVAETKAANAGGVEEGVPGASGGTSGINSVTIGGGLPTTVPPAAPGSNGARPTSAMPHGAASPRIMSGLLSTIRLGGTLATSQGEKTRTGLLGHLISSATATNTRNAESGNDATTGSVGAMSQPNANLVRGSPLGSAVTTEDSGNINMASGTPPRIRPFGLISRLRTTAVLGRAIDKLKHKNAAPDVAPSTPSSPVAESTTVTNGASLSSIPRASSLDAHRDVLARASQMAPGTENGVPASTMLQAMNTSGTTSGLASVTGLGGVLNTSHGNNAGSGMVLRSTNNSVAEINAGSATTNTGLFGTARAISEANTNYATNPSNATPVMTPERSDNKNAASGAPEGNLSPGATSKRGTTAAVNTTFKELRAAKSRSSVALANPSLPVAVTGVVNPSAASISPGVPSGSLRAPGVEVTGRPAMVPQSMGPETPREPLTPTVSSVMPGGSVTPSATSPVPESPSSAGLPNVAGATMSKTPHETPIPSVGSEAQRQPANATPSLGPPVGGAEVSSVGTTPHGTAKTASRVPINEVLAPNNAVPASKPEEIPATTSKSEGRPTILSKLKNVGAVVSSPVTGGAEASRTFVRNLLGMGLRRRLIS
uniref:Putative secreted peptide n=1 Tax=Rhipicephalus pulchellus TaxID=72859 RepID=L7M8S0_RHIPC